MSTILWLISFMLHGTLIYFVIILYARLGAFKEAEKNQKQMLEETENTLTAFLMELKDENDKLVQELQKDRAAEVKQKPGKFEEEPALSLPELKEKDADLPLYIESMIHEVEREEDELNQEEDEEAVSFEEKAVLLYEQGLSIEEVAKQLKSGKTEVELLLKFRGKLKNDS
ncbi:Swarming motility protein SwrB [Bacillus sp. CLL-7-23]|uniref:Swarming motility protein SwrB n=1 Tax=Bacillus changyiensis TaxID=3004103 RepID=A0ABT4X0U4_9BACI|nr:Swarming motility protein SwrB [Bacillus changyiensis]MDA7025838.1 Swarming motility protein SwrB [Bacillus changyiensis]